MLAVLLACGFSLVSFDQNSTKVRLRPDSTAIRQPQTWEVWRRFSHFEKLRSKLKDGGVLSQPGAPPGWTPPTLPAKTMYGSQVGLSSRFIE